MDLSFLHTLLTQGFKVRTVKWHGSSAHKWAKYTRLRRMTHIEISKGKHGPLCARRQVPEKAEITVVKKVLYKKEEIEAAWPLGAAINLLSSSISG